MENIERTSETVLSKKIGRPVGSKTLGKYKWNIIMFDGTKIIDKKYSTREELNKDLGLNLSLQVFWRIRYYKPDEEQKHKKRSFIKNYGHIRINEIDEIRV
jgi:hypothetical protein